MNAEQPVSSAEATDPLSAEATDPLSAESADSLRTESPMTAESADPAAARAESMNHRAQGVSNPRATVG